MKCPKCSGEISEEANFCKYCGVELNWRTIPQATTQSPEEYVIETEVKNTITSRIDAIKNRNATTIENLIDNSYTKFDDWPPFTRQEVDEALRNEFDALKVLSDYRYELKNLEISICDNVVVATFYIQYQGTIRDRHFDIASRVTSVLRKQGIEWKIVHEHFSRFSDESKRRFFP